MALANWAVPSSILKSFFHYDKRAEKEGDMLIRLVLTSDLIPVTKPVRL